MRIVKHEEDDHYYALNEFVQDYDVLTMIKLTTAPPHDTTWYERNKEIAHMYFHLDKTTSNRFTEELGYQFAMPDSGGDSEASSVAGSTLSTADSSDVDFKKYM